MFVCETSLNADRKKCIFNDRDDFATVIIRFFDTFLRMSVEPVARFLSPARAPRGLHRALFMNSVSHGKDLD